MTVLATREAPNGVGCGFSVVGNGIKWFGFPHALGFIKDNDAVGWAFTLEADLNGAIGQMTRSFKANGFKGEGVVGADGAVLFDKKHFVVGFVGRQVTNPGAVEGETV